MIISEKALIRSGAEAKVYKKKDFIFHEGEQPRYYFQILYGNVSLINYQEDGKEFIQNFFNDGDSIHESSLFDDSQYAVNAVAESDCTIYRLDKVKFLDLVDSNSEIKDLININSAKQLNF